MKGNQTMQIASPCIRKCKAIDGACISCKRTVGEILNWRDYTDEQREKIIQELELRDQVRGR